jgi:hypothetical protein
MASEDAQLPAERSGGERRKGGWSKIFYRRGALKYRDAMDSRIWETK